MTWSMDGGSAVAEVLRVVLALVPVLLFLYSLVWLDSFKLVTLRSIVRLIAAGGLAAVASWIINQAIGAEMDPLLVRRWVAPLVEEPLKAAPLLFLLRRKRIGFLVDGVIVGYAVGTGFALVENIYYLWALDDASMLLWLIRGVGTAIMHGAATAMLVIVTIDLQQRRGSDSLALAVPGLIVAFALHSAFNHFVISPLLSAALMMLLVPPLLALVFERSERYLQGWLGTGFDRDADLIRLMHSGDFQESKMGRYLATLRDRFEGSVLADMLCYLQLQAELSLQAKGALMMRENGFEVERDPAVASKIAELAFLEKSIGRTGLFALRPILHTTPHDRWQINMLTE
jgi:RsiW-degrading membrane proteinase PrsW (M82 family)